MQSSQYEITEAHGAWTSSAPAYLSAHQSVERLRLEAIKENLAKYETMCNDIGREKMEMAERGLVSILSWEIDEEVNGFLAAEGNRRATGSEGASLSASTTRASEMGQVQPSYSAPPPSQQQQAPISADRQVAPAFAPSTFLGAPEREATPSIHSVQSRNSHSGKSGGGLFSSFKKKVKPGLNRNRSSSHGNNTYGNLDSSRNIPTRQMSQHPQDTSDGSSSYRGPREDETEALSTRAMSTDSTDYPASTTSNSNKRSSFLPGMLRRKNSVSKQSSPAPIRTNSSSNARVGGLLSPPTEERVSSPVIEDFTPTPTRESTNPFDRPNTSMNGNSQQVSESSDLSRCSLDLDASSLIDRFTKQWCR